MKKTFIALFSLIFLVSCATKKNVVETKNTVLSHDAKYKEITVNDLWKDYTFWTRSIPGFNFLNDGKHFTRLQKGVIQKYDITTGAHVSDIFSGGDYAGTGDFDGSFDSYTFSKDEQKILIKTDVESIYRHSTRAIFYVFDIQNKTLTKVGDADGKIRYATFDPNASKVAYVYGNDLYYYELETGRTTRITNDGKVNHIINGATDWVYEEEFSFDKAFFWSPDGRHIAYMRFDESDVKEFTMTLYNDETYPQYTTFKYPKVGEKNAYVTAHVYDINQGKTYDIDIDEGDEYYIPRIKWTKDPDNVLIYKMNRHQNDLKLIAYHCSSKSQNILLHETNKYYIDITDDITFLDDGRFLWTSEKSGYNHIYVHQADGEQILDLTPYDYDVTAFYGVDEKRGLVYYQAAAKSPLQRELYKVSLVGGSPIKISKREGTHRAQWSSTHDYYIDTYSTINTAPNYIVYDRAGKQIRVIEDNAYVPGLQEEYGAAKIEFFTFTTDQGVLLNGWILKPKDFNPHRIYPLFMTQYSGPGSQSVTDSWMGNNYWWYQQLAQKGYIVACVDPRGTGGRGQEFKKMTYLQLGKYETIDQIQAAKYLGSKPYIDQDRIGIFGWSYGGYMSSLCILKGNDVFKSAIAVAPVTSWRWYDTIYTERYMRTVAENEAGYIENSPVYFADRLKGNYLLIHGLADDNVHFQNSAEMMKALIKANKQFDTYVYPNRNHGIYGDNARVHLWTKMNDFIINKI